MRPTPEHRKRKQMKNVEEWRIRADFENRLAVIRVVLTVWQVLLKLRTWRCLCCCLSVGIQPLNGSQAFVNHHTTTHCSILRLPSPRMPHTLGEIFAHAHSLDFKNRNSWAGPVAASASVLVDQHVRSGPETATRSQQPALLQTAAETTAGGSTGKEDLKADRRVRHYKEVRLQEWPLAGRATIPRVVYHGDLGHTQSVLGRWCDGDGGFQSFQVPRNFRS